MPKAEELPKKQPAEIHVDGIPRYAGGVSALIEQGLLLVGARLMRGKQNGDQLQIHTGSQADLVFLDLFDEDGSPLIAPVTLESSSGTDIMLTFRDAVSIATGHLVSALRSGSEPGEQKKRGTLLALCHQGAGEISRLGSHLRRALSRSVNISKSALERPDLAAKSSAAVVLLSGFSAPRKSRR